MSLQNALNREGREARKDLKVFLATFACFAVKKAWK